MDDPADLINVAVEELVKERRELPAFSTLDRLARHIRYAVNSRYYHQVFGRLSSDERDRLSNLLETDMTRRSDLNLLKQGAKSASVTHMQEQQTRLVWLLGFGDVDRLLMGMPQPKIVHLAAEARALDASELRDISPPKRYAMLLCLLHRARVAARDGLVEMFLKRIGRIHARGKEELERLRREHRTTAEGLIGVLGRILEAEEAGEDEADLGRRVREVLSVHGGVEALREGCEAVSAYNGNNYLPLLWKFYRGHRSLLFRIVRSLEICSTTQDRNLVAALDFLLENEHRRGEWLPAEVGLGFASEQWQRTVLARKENRYMLNRRHLEICVFSYLAAEFKTGDLCVAGSEEFADYREQLLPWEECEPMVAGYYRELGFEGTPDAFVEQPRDWLTRTAEAVDKGYPESGQVVIGGNGEPVLKRLPRRPLPAGLAALEAQLSGRMPERNLLDVLCNVEHWTGWTKHFGPLSGSDPKLERARERYIVTAFAYGCNLGPTQTARHTRGLVTPHMLGFANRRHVTAQKLEAATRDIVNSYSRIQLPKLWGAGRAAAADGTKLELYENNLLSEYHIRYGGYGGIAYHHVSDTYVALFTHFISCGVWEAVYIIDGLLKNTSDIQPDTLHADTQGQSTPVFALAHLLGIKLMPRIRNWQDLVFYRPSKQAAYEHIDPLFGDPVDWKLIRTHWRDLLRVVLSIRAGTVLPSTLLRKLGNYSHKNRLYQAFRELGRVVRMVFLLEYLSDARLRERITASTNKAEAYNGFSKWLAFGGDGVNTENDPDEQEKRVKYTDLVANAVILHNAVDMTRALRELIGEGYVVTSEELAALSPYLTGHIKRFGDYVLDLGIVPEPIEVDLPFEV